MAGVDRWNWANLSRDQENYLKEGERTLGLGVDILLAFQEEMGGAIGKGVFQRSSLEIGRINESQIQCLQGLEKKIGAVIVAYQQAG